MIVSIYRARPTVSFYCRDKKLESDLITEKKADCKNMQTHTTSHDQRHKGTMSRAESGHKSKNMEMTGKHGDADAACNIDILTTVGHGIKISPLLWRRVHE